jgi:hypothetical protein
LLYPQAQQVQFDMHSPPSSQPGLGFDNETYDGSEDTPANTGGFKYLLEEFKYLIFQDQQFHAEFAKQKFPWREKSTSMLFAVNSAVRLK